jgi:protein translocase SecG subunit
MAGRGLGKIGQSMAQIRPYLVVAELVISFLLMGGVLLQTPKATGLGGTIGGGGGDFGGGYRTRRGLERQLYWTTWVLVFGFLAVSLANILVATHTK